MFFATLPLVDIFVRVGEKHFVGRNLWWSSLRSSSKYWRRGFYHFSGNTCKLRQFIDLCALLFLLATRKIYHNHKANEEAEAVYYTVIKHSGHFMIWEHSRNVEKNLHAARVFHTSLVFSYARRVLSQYNIRHRPLYWLTSIFLWQLSYIVRTWRSTTIATW